MSGSARRPGLVINVGVTGHRHLSGVDLEDLRTKLNDTFARIESAVQRIANDADFGYARVDARLRLVGMLAAGADQEAAKIARWRKWELHAPLPFPADEFRRDFVPPPGKESDPQEQRLATEARKCFEELWPLPTTRRLELDGVRAEEEAAYEAAGRVMLNQSDVVIAIVDDSRPRWRGGAAQIMSEAIAARIPVIWIDPARKSVVVRTRDRNQPTRDEPVEAVEAVIAEIAQPPEHEPSSGHHDPELCCEDYLVERAREPLSLVRWLYTRTWQVFFRGASFAADGQPPTESLAAGDPANKQLAAIRDDYFPHWQLADALAQRHANLYRSSFVLNYIMCATAVTLALLSLVISQYSRAFLLTELLMILSIIGNLWIARRGHWRIKSSDYRLLAEQLRQMRALAPLGRVSPFPRPPAHHHRDAGRSWMHWYFRALVREFGMPADTIVDRAYRQECCRLIRDELIAGQLAYHRRAAARYATIRHRMHAAALGFFGLTLVACVLHLLPESWPGGRWLHHHSMWLTLVAAAAPAWAAAVHGISTQAETTKLADRYSAMADLLAQYHRQLDPVPPTSIHLAGIATRVAQSMIDEVVDWRIVYPSNLTTPA